MHRKNKSVELITPVQMEEAMQEYELQIAVEKLAGKVEKGN